MPSRRAAHDAEPNALTRALAARRAAGLPVLDLTVSNPTTADLPYAREAILGALADPAALAYEPAALGLSSARAAVARMEGTTAERVALTASTSEAYANVLKLFCDPGDEVLVPAPSYPLFGPLATFEGADPVAYRLAYDGAWHVDLASLRAARTERARAIFVVSPNNPTGSVLSQLELDAMAELELPIVIDEVFAPYLFAPRPRASAARALTLRLGGLSKLAALPQLKLAWTVVDGPAARVDEVMRGLEWISDAYLSCGAPVQHALPRLLEASALTRDAIRARTRRNLDALRAAAAGTALTVLDVEGGWYACVRLPGTRTEEAWCLELLDRGLLVHPGHFFDFDREAFAVVSLLTRPDELDRGVATLTDAVHRLS